MQGPQAQFSPWLRGGRSQLAAPQGHFHPAVIAEGARCPRDSWPPGSSGHPHSGGRSLRLHYTWTAAVIRLPRWGRGRGSLPLQDLERASEQPWRGLWSPAGSSLFPGAPSTPSGTGRVSRRALRRKAGSNSYLALRLRTTIPLTVGWIANKSRPLTAGHLGEGHTAAPTNSWEGPLAVLAWQLLTWGRGPPQHQPIAEQVH